MNISLSNWVGPVGLDLRHGAIPATETIDKGTIKAITDPYRSLPLPLSPRKTKISA